MAAIPYMPLYVADYLADAGHLTTLQHGAYLLLLMNYWQRGKGLPATDAALMSITRLSRKEWEQNSEVLMDFFTEADGLWIHKRVEVELAKFRAKSEQARNAGLASAERRLNVRSTPVDVSLPSSFNHTDTDTDTEKHKVKPSSASGEKRAAAVVASDAWFDSEFWPAWPVARNRKAAKVAARKIKPQDRPKVVAGVKAQASRIAAMERPIHAATWINGARWEDTLEPLFAGQPAVEQWPGQFAGRPHPGLVSKPYVPGAFIR